MPRIDIELTSSRPDGTWTWRAAGARQPKGVVEASVLHAGAKVGDVVKAEADFDLDGINVTSVVAPKAKKAGPELLPLLGSGREEALVTHSPLKPEREGGDRGRRGDRDRGDRDRGDRGDRRERPGGRPGGPGTTRPRATPGPRDGAPPRERERERPARADRPERPRAERPAAERPSGDRPSGDRPAGDRSAGDRSGRERRARPPSTPPPARPRPQAKRLQPGRAHREATLSGLPPEERAIAEQVLRGGLAGVRQAVDEQNAQARAAGGPEIRADAILSLAEELLPRLRAAEWRDKAEAAVASVDEISLRDLRTVVATSDVAGRDEESRALAARLREGLERRSAAERQGWIDEIVTCLDEGRVVRALRVSGRAPEQGVRLPPELQTRLGQTAGEAMGADTAPDRWLALLEAVQTSPVRRTLAPKALPSGADETAMAAIRQAAPKVPALGPLLGAPATARPLPPPPPRRRITPPPAVAPAEPEPAEPAEPAPAEPAPTSVDEALVPEPEPVLVPAPEPAAAEATLPQPAAGAAEPVVEALLAEPALAEPVDPVSPEPRPEPF